MAKKKHLPEASGTPELAFMNHGGKRKGAGRKPKRHRDGARVEPSHARRPRFTKSRPLHVTVEVAEDVPNLRAANMAPLVIDAIGRANVREDFRVVHVCILGTHIHMICEAEGVEELANGMRSVNNTIAKAVNKRLGRKGAVMPRRFHSHVLRTKREVRNAVQYVLRNAERHGLHDAWPGCARGAETGTGTRSALASPGLPRPDPLSTAAWFPYWAEGELVIASSQIPASVVQPAQCFLMMLAFKDAPLSFAEPMANASTRKALGGRAKGTRQHGSTTGARATELERAREVSSPPNQVPPRRQMG
jgi:hypothetical protein